MTKKDSEYYINCFKNLNRSKKAGQVAPHKVVLLLAVIELIEKGIIKNEVIELSDELINAFTRIWNDGVKSDIFKCNIALPYYHMNSEPFWKLICHKDTLPLTTPSINTLRNNYKGAKIDPDLYCFMRTPVGKEELREELSKHIDLPETMILSGHDVFRSMLKAQGIDHLTPDFPLWKLKVTEDMYANLKACLYKAAREGQLDEYGKEAAIFYAEWWRREYAGDIPSKEDIAETLGIPYFSEELYKAARRALKRIGYKFIRSQHRTEYFRTMLNLGGLPINYIKNNDGNFSSFKRFLQGLVRELSLINYDWTDTDNSIINQFNCITYLGRSFRNENIYDVSMQIAHAIIMDNETYLPYDSSDESFQALTKSLRSELHRARKEKRIKPLTLNWKLATTPEGKGILMFNMDIIKEVSSFSIPGLNIKTCSAFDVIVAGQLVAQYSRSKINKDPETSEIIEVIYSRRSIGISKDIIWNGDPVVEVKVRCDNDDRLFLTISGSYPPNFNYPQLFQKVDDTLYTKCTTASSENNIAVFSNEWSCADFKLIEIQGTTYRYVDVCDDIPLRNIETGEEFVIQNLFTEYTAEFSNNYIQWLEKSSHKLCTSIPAIHVYDKEKNVVNNIKKYYRKHSSDTRWRAITSACVLPIGLVDIKVEFPDGHFTVETFYSIGKLDFESANEKVDSTDLICNSGGNFVVEVEHKDEIVVSKKSADSWSISQNHSVSTLASTCAFRLYRTAEPTLRIEIPIPFDGINIIDMFGNTVPNGKIVSLSNLSFFKIISHGASNRRIDVTYEDSNEESEVKQKHLRGSVYEGIVSMAEYEDLVNRIFNLYGENSFSRSCSAIISIGDKQVQVRKFILDSTIEDNSVIINDNTEANIQDFNYSGTLYAYPVGDEIDPSDFKVYQLEQVEDRPNAFKLPEDFPGIEAVVFSGPETKRRIVPKYYCFESEDFNIEERSYRMLTNVSWWREKLHTDNLFAGKYWRLACLSYSIANRYNLPYSSFNCIKAIAGSPDLLVKFALEMWLNEMKDIMLQDIERFEQELMLSFHWIPVANWSSAINDLFASLPEPMLPFIGSKISGFIEFTHEIFQSTLSFEIANEYNKLIGGANIGKGEPFYNWDITNYTAQIKGLSDINDDLPVVKHNLAGRYYDGQRLLPYYKVMIESAMLAAENCCHPRAKINLFAFENKEHSRAVNFYRKYFKEIYSEIFIRTVRLINSEKK